MTLNYQKIWNTMNDLEMVTCKVASAREILDSAVDKLQEHQYDKAETLMYAADEFLQYYLEDFDRKFKDAWKETVTKVHQETIKIDDLRRSWDSPEMWEKEKDTVQFNIDPAGNEYDYLANSLLTEDRISNFPEEQDHCMPPWGHSDMEYLACNKDDTSPECKGAWNSFWEEEPKQDKVVKWRLPVERKIEDGVDDYYIQFPDDLLEAANLKVGDIVTWIDNGDGTYTLKHKTMSDTITSHDPYKDEMIAAGYKMVDGVWTQVTKTEEN